MLNVTFDPFLRRKTPFFTLFILSRASDNSTSLNISRASDNTTSLNIGGPVHGRPHLKFLFVDRPPSPP